MKLTNTHKKIFSNVIWSLGGKIVSMASALFVGILVARYLGPEKYGLMNYVISYVALFTVVASFGMNNIEIRELSKHNENRNTILGTCFRLRLMFAVMAYLLMCVTLLIYKSDAFTSAMILTYGLVLFTETGAVLRNYFTSIVKNEYIAKSEIFRTLIGAVVKILLLWFKAPLQYFIIAQLFDSFLVASGYYICYKKSVGSLREWNFDKTLIPYIVKESFPLLLSGAAIIIYQRIDQVMIGNMLSKEDVGYFATAGKFVDLILFIPTVLVQTITPMLVRIKEQNELSYEQKKRTFVSITTWIAIIISFMVSLMAFCLIRYTFGESYIAAIPVLQIMAYKAVGMALSASGGQIIIIERMQKWAFIRNVLGCFLCIILNYYLLPIYGIVGSAAITIFTVLFTGTLSNVLIPQYHSIFKIQMYALFFGWKELAYFKQIIKK